MKDSTKKPSNEGNDQKNSEAAVSSTSQKVIKLQIEQNEKGSEEEEEFVNHPHCA